MPTDWWLVASAVLILGLGVFHSLLGEIYLVRRLLRREDLPRLFGGDSFTKLTIRYAWHLLTLLCVASCALLVYAATAEGEAARVIASVFAGTFVVMGVWGLVATRGRHLSWIVLLVAGALAAMGAA